MKTLLILILSALLLAALTLGRPNEASFRQMAGAQLTSEASGFWQKMTLDTRVKDFFTDTRFSDRILWTEVRHRDGTRFIGACGHWFELDGWMPRQIRSAYPQDPTRSGPTEKTARAVASTSFDWGR
jgi:hypothetical protein